MKRVLLMAAGLVLQAAPLLAQASEQEAFPRPERPADGRGEADYDARFLDWQAEYSRRVQARVEPLLNSQQVAQYRAAVEVQNARRANQRASAEQRRGNPGRQ